MTMRLPRREWFRQFGAAAAAATVLPAFDDSAAGSPVPLVRLNRNESAYGPSEKARTALREAIAEACRFPEGEDELRAAIARHHNVQPENVTLGCGSTEIFRMAAEAWLVPRKNLVVAEPTYSVISDAARVVDAEVRRVPLTHAYAHDLESMLSRSDSRTGLFYICNPNNPTGSLTSKSEIEAFLQQVPETARVILDEAYHEYVSPSGAYASWVSRAASDPRLVVTRTFSKIHGLAGLRVGYAISSAENAERLSARRLPMSVSSVAVRAAGASLSDSAYIKKIAALNENHRQEFFNQANARMLRWLDSQANFVLMAVGHPGNEVAEILRAKGILVASGFPRFPQYIRVSLGLPEEMRAFWRAWDAAMPHHPM